MNAHRNVDKQHPHFVAIPDAHAEGVRAYREADIPHPLQIRFLEEAGERSWVEEMQTLLSSGRVSEAEARLVSELESLEGSLARLCKSIAASDVTLEGWDDLLPILEEWEGPAITAITLGMTNLPDLVFEAGKGHEPELLTGLYSDDAFPFAGSSKADLVAECAKDMPGWVGAEEDVEFYCTLSGLADLNTEIIQSKHRHFLRDGRDGVVGRAPGGYVEYVLGCWFIAMRFLQAVERSVAAHRLPKGCRLFVGSVETGSDFLCVFGPDKPFKSPAPVNSNAQQPSLASLTIKPWVPREDPIEPPPALVSTLRQRLKPAQVEPPEPARLGLLSRLFGWLRLR